MGTAIYRSDVLGSLLRPAYLKEARRALRKGEMLAADFKRTEDRAVDEALRLQEQAGLDVINDGEQRRASFLGSLIETVDGLSRTSALAKPWRSDAGDVTDLSLGLVVTGKLRYRRSLVAEEFAYARSKAKRPLKVTLPSPLMLWMFWSLNESREAYGDPFDLFADGAEVIRSEIRELARMGCEYIQIDAPEFAILIEGSGRLFAEAGIAPERVRGEGTEIVNSLADAPGVSFGIHLCRGNNDGRWLAHGGYEAISKEVLGRMTRYERVLLEYDDARSGSFEPLRDIPRDKFVVLGLVSTKKNTLESESELRARVDEASRYFPRDQLGISTQCGFASGIKGNPVDGAMQERKLRLVAGVARQIRG